MLFLGLISPDQPLCRAVGQQLKQDGLWQMAVLSGLAEALESWHAALPSLIFWDAEKAPGTLDLAQKLATRIEAETTPPLLLTLGPEVPAPFEPDSVTERFSRPLRLGVFLTRLTFYARVLQQSPDLPLELGRWIYLPRSRLLRPRREGSAIKLTDKEAHLLSFLYAATKPVPRDEILATVWGYHPGLDTHTLETHIYRLRRKIMGAEPVGEDVFLTEGGGYRLNPLWRRQ